MLRASTRVWSRSSVGGGSVHRDRRRIFVGPRLVPPTRVWPAASAPIAEKGRRRLVTLSILFGAATMTMIYLTWRLLFTLDASTFLLGIPLLIIEVWNFISAILFTMMLWNLNSIPPASPRSTAALKTTVLIPTYNEPREVLLPTLSAAAQIRLADAVWVLDDGRREWVRTACEQLGLVYRVREGNEHAKAGNLNAALPDISTPLICVLDADHVPAPEILSRTIGYFDDPKVALVQTPQDFYNTEASFEHETEGDRLYSEQELFYRMLEAGRNRWNAAFWCGTGALLRVEALRDIGGVATASITEDILTTIRLHRGGWRSVHHNEVLARGLAAVSADQYLLQRQRWGSGAMQTLRAERFLTGPGLTLPQRLSYLATLTGWFESWTTLILLLLPALTLLTGIAPISAPLVVFVAIFGLTFLLQKLAFWRLTQGRAPWWRSSVFSIIRLPATLAATMTLFTRKPLAFHVTHKGRVDGRRRRNRVSPLLPVLLAISAAALIWGVAVLSGLTPLRYDTPWIAWFAMAWLVVNALLVVVAVRRVRSDRFASERRSSTRVPLDGTAMIQGVVGRIVDLSLGGASLLTAAPLAVGERVSVHITDDAGRTADLIGEVRAALLQDEGILVKLQFGVESEMAMARLLAPVIAQVEPPASGAGPTPDGRL